MVIKKLLEEFDEDIIVAFVQKNADYYLTKWKLMAGLNKKISWNWPAFLFGGFWLLYRKMYLYFFILLLVGSLSAIPVIGMFISLAIFIGLGLFGNYLYGKFTYEKLTKLKITANGDKETLRQLAFQKGGTSVTAVIIAGAIYILLIIMLIMSAKSYEQW
jgi:hypothetical protein